MILISFLAAFLHPSSINVLKAKYSLLQIQMEDQICSSEILNENIIQLKYILLEWKKNMTKIFLVKYKFILIE